MKDTKLKDTKLIEALKNLVEQGLAEVDNPESTLFRITKKGCDEVIRWKESHLEMDILLFGFNNLKDKIKRGELKWEHGG